MSASRARLLEHVRLLAQDMPRPVVDEVANILELVPTGDFETIRRQVAGVIAHPVYRQLAGRLIDVWAVDCPEVPPEAIGIALQGVSHAIVTAERRARYELVWTGPSPETTPLRRTDQALLQVIDEARHDLTIVTFVIYGMPDVPEAIVRASRRGVSIRLIAESPEASGGRITHDGVASLGEDVIRRIEVYVWPVANRPATPDGRYGALHVKCAVADERALFVSSANLTEHALTLNMEMGILVVGGRLPVRVSQHLDGLIRSGVLVRVDDD